MGAPGWTSFCANGHIVEVCGHHQIIFDEKQTCDLCGAKVVGTDIEWGDPDYPHIVPEKPINSESVKITKKYKGKEVKESIKVNVYDVSGFNTKRL